MKRYRQTVDELLGALSPIEASWRDEHSKAVILLLETIPQKLSYSPDDVAALLKGNFQAGLTVLRLILDLSKDEFTAALQTALGPGGTGVQRYQQDPARFVSTLISLGALDSLRDIAIAPCRGGAFSWNG